MRALCVNGGSNFYDIGLPRRKSASHCALPPAANALRWGLVLT